MCGLVHASFSRVPPTIHPQECFISMDAFSFLMLFDAIAFFLYGLTCLLSPRMRIEFARFHLNNSQRMLAGWAQLLGAAGLLVGYHYSALLGSLAALGLALLMLAGFGVRRRIKDNWAESLPSLLFLLLNVYLCYAFVNG